MSRPCATPGCHDVIRRQYGTRCAACASRKQRTGTYDPAAALARRGPRPCANPGCGTIIPTRRYCPRCNTHKQKHGAFPDLAHRAPLAAPAACPAPVPWTPPDWYVESARPDTGWDWELQTALAALPFLRCEGDRQITEEEQAA